MPLALLRWVIRKYGFWWRVIALRLLKLYFGGSKKIPDHLSKAIVPDWADDVVRRIALIGNFGKTLGATESDIFLKIASVLQQRLHCEHDALLVEKIIFAKYPVKAFLTYLIVNDQLTNVMRQRLYVNFHIVRHQVTAA